MKFYRKQFGAQSWEETNEVIVKDDIEVLTGLEIKTLVGMPFEIRIGFDPSRSYHARSELENE